VKHQFIDLLLLILGMLRQNRRLRSSVAKILNTNKLNKAQQLLPDLFCDTARKIALEAEVLFATL
jgi:hypothetical protein